MKKFMHTLVISFVLLGCSERFINEPVEENIPGPEQSLEIKIISPKFGEVLTQGTSKTIEWSFPSASKRLQIRLYRKTELKNIISLAAENNGRYIWNIPSDLRGSVHYRIEIFDIDSPNKTAISEYFYINPKSYD